MGYFYLSCLMLLTYCLIRAPTLHECLWIQSNFRASDKIHSKAINVLTFDLANNWCKLAGEHTKYIYVTKSNAAIALYLLQIGEK